MHMKTFLQILKRRLCEKYHDILFEFYLLRHTKNVHMGLNCRLQYMNMKKLFLILRRSAYQKDRIQNLNLCHHS